MVPADAVVGLADRGGHRRAGAAGGHDRVHDADLDRGVHAAGGAGVLLGQHGLDGLALVLGHLGQLAPVQEKVVSRIMALTQPDTITIHDDMGLIATVGRGMVHNPGTAARLFTALSTAHVNVRMIDQGSSELSILVGVDRCDFEASIRAIYHEFVK